MGTKPSHTGPIGLFTPLASSPHPRVPRQFIEMPIGLLSWGSSLVLLKTLGLPSISVELAGLWTLPASFCDMSRGVKSLSKIPLSVADH